jgi:hypothetical protein
MREEDHQDWKLKWGNDKRTIEIEKWNEEMRGWILRLKIENWNEEMRRRISGLKNEIRKSEEE